MASAAWCCRRRLKRNTGTLRSSGNGNRFFLLPRGGGKKKAGRNSAITCVGRAVTISLASLCLAGIWILASLLTYRLNPGYLWLVIGVPTLFGYVLLRSLRHRAFRAPSNSTLHRT